MIIVKNALNRIINTFFYSGVLLLIFTIIYSLLGRTLFSNLNFDKNYNYSDFKSSFLNELQIVTLEGYPEILFDLADK